jgi:hypothetical protein
MPAIASIQFITENGIHKLTFTIRDKTIDISIINGDIFACWQTLSPDDAKILLPLIERLANS